MFMRFRVKPDAKKSVDMTTDFANVPVLHCTTRAEGFSEYFSDPDVNAIKSYRLDFIVRFGFGIIKGEILQVAQYGVWSYHHDDEQFYRGVPSCFWEIYEGNPVTAAILQRLTARLDSGVILKKGYWGTINHSFTANMNQLLSGTSEWLLQVCRDIQQGTAPYFNFQQSTSPAPMRYVPGNWKMAKFLLLILKNKITFHYKELFRHEIWNVGVVKMSVNQFVEKRFAEDAMDIHWLPEIKRGRYLADIFSYTSNEKDYFLCELYDYKKQKANITQFSLLNEATVNVNDRKLVISGANHFSFPYIFENEGNIYCIPECYQSSCLKIFRLNVANGLFEFHTVLLESVRAVDPVLFRFNNLWWLLFTSDTHSNTKLYAYFSKEIFGQYQPHGNNPIKTDIRSSRSAGQLFMMNENLIRPAQDCSVTYGSRICLNAIQKLTPEEFEENSIGFIAPFKDSKYPGGLHTLSFTNQYTFIDGKKYAFIGVQFLFQLKRKIGI